MATNIASPSHRDIRLADELKGLRTETGKTLEQVVAGLKAMPSPGKVIPWDNSKLSKMERARSRPSKAELECVLNYYNVLGGAREELLALLAEGPPATWWRDFAIKPAFAEFLGHETEAFESWEHTVPGRFPGMGQTAAIAEQTVSAGADAPGEDQVEQYVTIRSRRHARLTTPPVLRHTAYFGELALAVKRDPKALAEQLRHLQELNELPHVSFRMIPFSAGEGAVLPSGLMLLAFPDPEAPKVSFVEAVGGMLSRGSARDIRHAERVLARLGTYALSLEDTNKALQHKLEEIS